MDVTRRYGIMETYIQGWDITFHNKEYFEDKMGCSIYDVLPEIGKTTLLCPHHGSLIKTSSRDLNSDFPVLNY